MNLIQHYIFRALCAIAVGALLIKYREDMVHGMTIAVGTLFFLSGLIAVITSYVKQAAVRKMLKAQQTQAETEPGTAQANQTNATVRTYGLSAFLGIGCMLLGLVLVLMPTTFINYLVYVFAGFLILGALQQFFSLSLAHREWRVGLGYWVMPSLLLIAGALAIAKPGLIASAPFFFIGWAMIIYGVVECINGIKGHQCHKRAVANADTSLTGRPDFSQAEEVEFEEVNDTPPAS